MAWLAVITLFLIVLAGLVLGLANISINGEEGFIEGAWASLMRTLDPGTMGGDAGWGFRIVALLVTLGGLFIVSTLIGLIANAIGIKLENLRKGRSVVAEEGHTLILGWSPKVLTIVSELMVANANQPHSVIVLMSSEDKVSMEDTLRSHVTYNKHTKVVCRTGSIADPMDLALVNPLGAKAIIVVSPDTDGADAEAIRCVLALMQHDPDLQRNLIVELIDEKNAEALGVATEGRITTVVSSEIIARVTAQVCRQSGLSAVYQELLDFDGDEIYFAVVPEVVGMTFAASLQAFRTSSVIGVRFADGRVELNPPMETVLADGDALIAIAEDDDKIVFSNPPQMNGSGPAMDASTDNVEEHLLIVGWHHLGPRLLRQLDDYAAPGSTAHIIYDERHVTPADLDLPSVGNLAVTTQTADTSQEGPLRAALAGGRFDHVIVLCYRKGFTVAESDARTLMTLLQLRRIVKAVEVETEEDISIVTELLDVKDVELARVANPDDFVVSEQLASLLMSQLAENPELGPVFADLFDSHESEIMLKPASRYVPIGQSIDFHFAVGSAERFQEIAIGYRKYEQGTGGSPTIVINPDKSEAVSFTDDDHLIILTTS